jgi:hypothetical protein
MDEQTYKGFVRFLAALDTLHDFCGSRNTAVAKAVVIKYAVPNQDELLKFINAVPVEDKTDIKNHAESLLNFEKHGHPSFEHSMLKFVKTIFEIYGMSTPEVSHIMLNNHDRQQFLEIMKSFYPDNDDDSDYIRYVADKGGKIPDEVLCGGRTQKTRIVDTAATVFDNRGHSAETKGVCREMIKINEFGLDKDANELMQYDKVRIRTDEIHLGNRVIKLSDLKRLQMGVTVYSEVLGHFIDRTRLYAATNSVLETLHINEDFPENTVGAVGNRVRAIFDYKRCGDWLQIQSCIPLQAAAADSKKYIYLTADIPAVARAISVKLPGTEMRHGIPVIHSTTKGDNTYKVTTYGEVKLTAGARLKKITYLMEIARVRESVLSIKEGADVSQVHDMLDELSDAIGAELVGWNRKRNAGRPTIILSGVNADILKLTKIYASSIQLELLCDLFTHLQYVTAWAQYFFHPSLDNINNFAEEFTFVDELKRDIESGKELSDSNLIEKTNTINESLKKNFRISSEHMLWLCNIPNLLEDIKAAIQWLSGLMHDRTDILTQNLADDTKHKVYAAISTAKAKKHYITLEVLSHYTKMQQYYVLYPPNNEKATLNWFSDNAWHVTKGKYVNYEDGMKQLSDRIYTNVLMTLQLPQHIGLIARRAELELMTRAVQGGASRQNIVKMTMDKLEHKLDTLQLQVETALSRPIAKVRISNIRRYEKQHDFLLEVMKKHKPSSNHSARLARLKGIHEKLQVLFTMHDARKDKTAQKRDRQDTSQEQDTVAKKRKQQGGNTRSYQSRLDMSSFAEYAWMQLRVPSKMMDRPYIVEWLGLVCGELDEVLPKTDAPNWGIYSGLELDESAVYKARDMIVMVPLHLVDVTDISTASAFVGTFKGNACFNAEVFTLMQFIHQMALSHNMTLSLSARSTSARPMSHSPSLPSPTSRTPSSSRLNTPSSSRLNTPSQHQEMGHGGATEKKQKNKVVVKRTKSTVMA